MELDGDDLTGDKGSKDVRKNIPFKLKGASRSRGRPRKVSKGSRTAKKKENSPEQKKVHTPAAEDDHGVPEHGDEEPLEEFSTMKVTGEEPLHKAQKLKWNHKVNLIGIKVVDPIIHTCSTCYLPILIYGRMIPCKHIFCFDCAKKSDKVCSRCNDPVTRVEQSALGAVFVCNYGGSKHGTSGCRRTYLSQRDLNAHIHYRHLKEQAEASKQAQPPAQQAPPPVPAAQQAPLPQVAITTPGQMSTYSMPMTSPPVVQPMQMVTGQPPPQQPVLDHSLRYHQPPPTGAPQHPPPPTQPPAQLQQPPTQQPPPQLHPNMPPPPVGGMHPQQPMGQGPMAQPRAPPPASSPMDNFHNIPVMSSRTSNLITVPIQDESEYNRRAQYPPGPQPVQFLHPPPSPNMMSAPPPTQHYNTGSTPPMMTPPPFSSTGHMPPPPQAMATSHPPMGGPRPPLNMNLSQPPPSAPMQHGALPPPPPRQGPPPPQTGPPMGNRYTTPPPRATFDNKPNMYGQLPPGNRPWQGGPPPPAPGPGPMGGGPPPNMAQPPPRPFYQ